MLGAIAGDIIGSSYKFTRRKDYDFELFTEESRFTDDTVMTLAVAQWLYRCEAERNNEEQLVRCMKELGRAYPGAGYGSMFNAWLWREESHSYGSYGNGAAMRVSPIGLYALTLRDALEGAKMSAEVSHSHPDGIKGAQAVAAAVWMANNGYPKNVIREYIERKFGYDMSRTIDEIRPTYKWDSSCQGSVPEAIIAFLDGRDFEDVVRLAVSLGGDADTQAAIAGGIAACVYPIPEHIAVECERRLPTELLEIMRNFEAFIKSRNQTNE